MTLRALILAALFSVALLGCPPNPGRAVNDAGAATGTGGAGG